VANAAFSAASAAEKAASRPWRLGYEDLFCLVLPIIAALFNHCGFELPVLVLACLPSMLSYRWIERPLMHLGRAPRCQSLFKISRARAKQGATTNGSNSQRLARRVSASESNG